MRGKRRPPEERVSSVAGPLPPCRVCGEQAAGFHYGVNTCEACKGFFRRSLLRNGEYECIGSDSCVIGPNRRKSCPKCRYLKCLSVGMSKEAIKTGRYTYMKRTQDTLELKMLKQVKQRLSSYSFVTENDCPPQILAEPTMYSLEQRSSHEAVVDSDGFFSNSCSSLSPDVVSSFGISSALKSSSPTVSTACSLLTDLTPYVPKEFMSISPDVSQEEMMNGIKYTDEFPERKSHNFDKHSDLVAGYQKHCNKSCSKLLSLITADEDQQFFQGSQKFETQPYSMKSLSVSGAKIPSSSSCSLYTSSLSSLSVRHHHLENSLSGTRCNSNVYSEGELDDFISVIVSGHRFFVEDANSIPDDVLQQLFSECKERCSLQTEIFGHLGAIKKDEHDQIYASTGLDVDGRLDNLSYAAQKMDIYVRQMVSFMKHIPGFRSLSLSDQTALVKASMSDLFILGYFRGYNRENLLVVEGSRSYCRHQMVIFNNEDEMDTIFIIAQKLQNLHLTFEMVVVLKALCVFFSDRATLEDPNTVDMLQMKTVHCLILLLQRHSPQDKNLKLARILSILAHTRNHAEDCQKFLKTNFQSGSYSERLYTVPIIFEFINSHSGY